MCGSYGVRTRRCLWHMVLVVLVGGLRERKRTAKVLRCRGFAPNFTCQVGNGGHAHVRCFRDGRLCIPPFPLPPPLLDQVHWGPVALRKMFFLLFPFKLLKQSTSIDFRAARAYFSKQSSKTTRQRNRSAARLPAYRTVARICRRTHKSTGGLTCSYSPVLELFIA